MKWLISLGIFLALIIGALKYGFSVYKSHLSDAIATSTLAAQAQCKTKTTKLHAKHKKELTQLRKENSKKLNRLIKKHKVELAKTKSKERAKAKVQRAVAAIPVMGVAAFALFEKLEFENWKTENPNGTFEQYSIEIGNEVNQILQNEYSEYYNEYRELFSIPNL